MTQSIQNMLSSTQDKIQSSLFHIIQQLLLALKTRNDNSSLSLFLFKLFLDFASLPNSNMPSKVFNSFQIIVGNEFPLQIPNNFYDNFLKVISNSSLLSSQLCLKFFQLIFENLSLNQSTLDSDLLMNCFLIIFSKKDFNCFEDLKLTFVFLKKVPNLKFFGTLEKLCFDFSSDESELVEIELLIEKFLKLNVVWVNKKGLNALQTLPHQMIFKFEKEISDFLLHPDPEIVLLCHSLIQKLIQIQND